MLIEQVGLRHIIRLAGVKSIDAVLEAQRTVLHVVSVSSEVHIRTGAVCK